MNQKARIISCAEYYSHLKNVPSNKVFEAFASTGLLDMILESGEKFPEMNLDFYMGMIDGIVSLSNDAQESTYLQFEKRTRLAIDVVDLLAKEHHLSDIEACHMYYGAKVSKQISEDSTLYYQKSPEEIFHLIEKE